MTVSRQAIGRIRCTASSFGHDPALETNAAKTPRIVPTHHVALIPKSSASSVGDSVAKRGSCPTVKYSAQTRAVTWS